MNDVRLQVLPIRDNLGQIKVRDAIRWSNEELLLATERGLRTFTLGTSKVGSQAIETGGRRIARLCRDTVGRLWIGGDGLTLFDADGKSLHSLDSLPMVGEREIVAMAADPGHPGGIIAALEGRGVVFVQATASLSGEPAGR